MGVTDGMENHQRKLERGRARGGGGDHEEKPCLKFCTANILSIKRFSNEWTEEIGNIKRKE